VSRPSREFVLDDAIALARCARAAYGARRGAELPDDPAFVKEISPCGQGCLIEHANLGRVLAFGGTDSVSDWLTDCDFLLGPHPLPFCDGAVHKGFSRDFERLQPWLGDLKRVRYITGHSLGGARATLASLFIETRYPVSRPVYTFGSPRVGDRIFARGYGLTQFRVVNDLDPVPRVPISLRYKHVGQAVWLMAGQLRMGLSWWRSLTEWMTAAQGGLLITAARELEEHSIDRYIEALEALGKPTAERQAA
jgi:Lipase (class 3)